jgi:hypothetical protein
MYVAKTKGEQQEQRHHRRKTVIALPISVKWLNHLDE